MQKEDALALIEEGVAELAAELDSGKSEQLITYLDAMSRFHTYSFRNQVLIISQRPNATRVAGFGAWKKMSRNVKAGEKGIGILAPMVRKAADGDEEDRAELFGFRLAHVFDIAQTDGKPLPELAQVSGDPGSLLVRLQGVAKCRGIELSYETSLGGAEGVSRGGAIVLLDGLPPAAEFVTLAHELAHEALHHGGDRDAYSRATRELEAESVAYVVGRSAGIRNALRQSADYVHLYGGNAERLTASLERIRKTAADILVELDPSKSAAARQGSLSA